MNELRKELKDYADRIHQRWLNARDTEIPTDFKDGVEWVYYIVENELRKMLKEDEELNKHAKENMWHKSIGDVLEETADTKKGVRK